MALYKVETKLSAEDILEKASRFLGKGGAGLKLVEKNPCCVYFEGGGGHVTVAVKESDEKKKNVVTLETREWDHHVKKFMSKL